MGRRPGWTDEQLIQAVQQSRSVAATCRALGLLPRGGNYWTVHRAVDRLGLTTSHWTGSGWSKGRKLGPSARRRPVSEIFQCERPVDSTTVRERLFADGLLPRVCAVCGLVEWLGAPIPLEVDHISGDRTDNRLANLRLLCPNCHARTDTYRGRNKKRHRKSERAEQIG